MKHCFKCGETKPRSEFNKHTKKPDGLQSTCTSCRKKHRVENADKIKAAGEAYRAANKDKLSAKHAKYYADNREKMNAASAAWRAANPEKQRAYEVAWRSANPDKVKACQTAYYAANPDKCRAANYAWNAANPENLRIMAHNRRARKREGGGRLSSGLAKRLLKLQRGKCACCGEPLGTDYHMDHIMPLALGGTNTDSNIQLLRAKCNLQKHAKHPVEFMQERGFLL